MEWYRCLVAWRSIQSSNRHALNGDYHFDKQMLHCYSEICDVESFGWTELQKSAPKEIQELGTSNVSRLNTTDCGLISRHINGVLQWTKGSKALPCMWRLLEMRNLLS